MSDTTTQPTKLKPKRERSPSFPFIPLKTAMNRLVAFDDYSNRHPVPAKHSGNAWGMKGYTSQAQQTLAALKSFGLVEYQGAADNLAASVTDDARTYLRAQQESVKNDVLKRIALKPKAIAKYFNLWGVKRPPDPVCLDQLVLKDGFTQDGARAFLFVYDDTLAYAGVTNLDKVAPDPDAEGDEGRGKLPRPEAVVGDLVNVEVGGALVFPEPKRVRAVQSGWVFLDGVEAGVEMENVEVVEKAIEKPVDVKVPPRLPLEKPKPNDELDEPGTRVARFVLKEGDVKITFPETLSSDSVEDLEGYLLVFLNKARREAGLAKKTS